MINYKKIGVALIFLPIFFVASFVASSYAQTQALSDEEQQTAHDCLQYLEKYKVSNIPSKAASSLKWCNDNIGAVCDLAEGNLTKEDCETKLDDWYTDYIPPVPTPQNISIPTTNTSPTTTTTPPLPTQNTDTMPPPPPPSENVSSPGTVSSPSTATSSPTNNNPTKSNDKKTPGINWF